jgi:MinD superfamily P-loop ATPase
MARDRGEGMREILIISGKGGTGKTSLAACFALLAHDPVLADCDVDAPDLHLVLEPSVRERHEFWSGMLAEVKAEACTGCGACLNLCRFGAISGGDVFQVDASLCEGCGACARFCPKGAVSLKERLCGEWMVSDTRAGPMVHARLGTGAENSGKLVSTVRQEAKKLAAAMGRSMLLVDGPPGIGCPVIASLSGVSAAILVAEPTLSGEHDVLRALELTRHFDVPAFLCVNKWDISPEIALRIEQEAMASGACILGRIRYDAGVREAQKNLKTALETDAPSASDIRSVWDKLLQHLTEKENHR